MLTKLARQFVLDFESEADVFTGKKKIDLKRIIAILESNLRTSFILKLKTNVLMEKVEIFMKELTEIRKQNTKFK